MLRSLSRFSHGLSHVDNSGLHTMVNVASKAITHRIATAQAKVVLPPIIQDMLSASADSSNVEIMGKKGPVISTSIIAGVLAAKKTSELIPFCHPIPLEQVDIKVNADQSENVDKNNLLITCTVSCTAKTGVEMEALVGVSNAALCIYDMLKAVSHDIIITDVKLVNKTGGKSDVNYQ